VLSGMWTEPDLWERGRLYLTVHQVYWREDVLYIDARPASPCDVTLEAAL
jgi:hypothetical protein